MKVAIGVLVLLVLSLTIGGGLFYRHTQQTEARLIADLEKSSTSLKATQSLLTESQSSAENLRKDLAASQATLASAHAAVATTATELAETKKQLGDAHAAGDKANERSAVLAGLASRVAQLENSLNVNQKQAIEAVRAAERLMTAAPSKESFAALKESYANLERVADRIAPLYESIEKHIETNQEALNESSAVVIPAVRKAADARSAIKGLRSGLNECSAAAKSADIGIYANQAWQPCAAYAEQGYIVAVQATGQWAFAPASGTRSGPQGVDWKPIYRVKADAANGALLARVHGSEQMFTALPSFVADRSGNIDFRINDDVVNDNSGTADVRVWVFKPIP